VIDFHLETSDRHYAELHDGHARSLHLRSSFLARTYAAAVHAAGEISVILTPNEEDVESLLDRMDGILLSGSTDLDPRCYGDETRNPTTCGINAERDGFEFALALMARAHDLPLLGICRGIQSLNVAFGGTLFQDIDD